MKLPEHLFVGCEGDLYDTRNPEWSKSPPLRSNYERHVRDIKTADDVKACLRAGPYAWPGGYACFFITSDGAVLSFEAARKGFLQIICSLKDGDHGTGWHVCGLGCTADEDETPVCEHTGKAIN